MRLSQVIWNLRRVGLSPLRGLAHWMLLPRPTYPLLRGRRVVIKFGSKITAGPYVYIGDYTRINAYSLGGIRMGRRVTIREFGILQLSSSWHRPGEGLVIGDFTYIGPRCNIGVGGAIRIGSHCAIGADFTAVAENHEVSVDGPSQVSVSRQGIEIQDGCWIGHRVTILDGVQLGERSVVGAGSVVTRSFPAKSVIAGNPAKLLRTL